MTHEHHHHEHTVTSLNKAFILGIALNVAFVVVEFAVGLSYGCCPMPGTTFPTSPACCWPCWPSGWRRRRLRPATPTATRKARC